MVLVIDTCRSSRSQSKTNYLAVEGRRHRCMDRTSAAAPRRPQTSPLLRVGRWGCFRCTIPDRQNRDPGKGADHGMLDENQAHRRSRKEGAYSFSLSLPANPARTSMIYTNTHDTHDDGQLTDDRQIVAIQVD